MSQQYCPNCGRKELTWHLEDGDPLTHWECDVCRYQAKEDEAKETLCERCLSKNKMALTDTAGHSYSYCTECFNGALPHPEIVSYLPGAKLHSYQLANGHLSIAMSLWDDTPHIFVARGVTDLTCTKDNAEIDGIVLDAIFANPAMNNEHGQGYVLRGKDGSDILIFRAYATGKD